MTRETYELRVVREGIWWIVDAPSAGHRTQARTLAEVDEMGRDLIAVALDVAPESFDLDVRIETPADVVEKLAEASEFDRDAHLAQARAAFERRAAARALRDGYGLSVIDAARVLGVSRGRVYQLLEETERASA